MDTNPSNQELAPEGPNLLVVTSKFVAVVEMTESWPRAEQAALLPLGLFPHIQHHK